MCLSYAWQYKCGCIAPKPTSNFLYRCTSWDFGKSCEAKQLLSYLDVDCSERCSWNDEAYRSHDWYLYNGPYQGQPSEEDYYFSRVPKQLVEPFFIRYSRRQRRTAVPKISSHGAEEQEMGLPEGCKEVELNDVDDSGLLYPDSEIAVDKSEAENMYRRQTLVVGSHGGESDRG